MLILLFVVVIDFCASTPCENGGTCSLSVNGFVCACVVTEEVQYGGQTCNQSMLLYSLITSCMWAGLISRVCCCMFFFCMLKTLSLPYLFELLYE